MVDNRIAQHGGSGSLSGAAEHLFGVFGAERFRGRRQVRGGCLLRRALQRNDGQVLAALAEVNDELQVDAWLAVPPENLIRRRTSNREPCLGTGMMPTGQVRPGPNETKSP